MMNWNQSAHKSLRSIAVTVGMSALLIPALAFAEQPEIDCMSLSDEDSQEFYSLSGQAQEAAANDDLDGALQLSLQAMKMCTTDAYTEYNLARVYQMRNNCPAALYHFDRLLSHINDIKADSADLAKAIKKNSADAKAQCGDAVSLEITCATPDSKIQVNGVIDEAMDCPVYTKIMPGSYALTATRDGFFPFKDQITVPADAGLVYSVPALQDENDYGILRVKCPRNAIKFILTDAKGISNEYACPWEGKVASGTYKIRLGNTDASADMTVEVAKQSQIEHQIPAATKSGCSASTLQTSSQGGFAALIMGLLGTLSFAALRRRRED